MGKEGYLGEPELPPCCVPHKKMPHTVDVRLDHRPVRPVHRYPLQSAIFSFDLSTLFFYIFYQPVFSEEHIIRSKMRIVAVACRPDEKHKLCRIGKTQPGP